MAQAYIELDTAIIGGGIAGLWLLNRLHQQGRHCALFERDALGAGQTLASQGMIHGGIKYTLAGALSGASEAIADMPRRWGDCFAGHGEIDLSKAKLLSEDFYMFSSKQSHSKISTFLASKLTRGRVEAVSEENLPEIFKGQSQAQVYKLLDIVVDTPSLLKVLSDPLSERIFKLPAEHRWQREGKTAVLVLNNNSDEPQAIRARNFIFCAGEGNAALLESLGLEKPAMQRRPLQQVCVKHKLPYRFYGHCMGAESTPRLTISSHPCADGEQVWYLGGSLAETGAKQHSEDVIANAQRELRELFPWLDFSDAEWRSLPINRAEPKQKGLVRPDKAFASRAEEVDNIIVGWPTKLALSPNFSDQAMALLPKTAIALTEDSLLPQLTKAEIAPAPWDTLFASSNSRNSDMENVK
ncbi:FAD-dependent oxidoreductase [Pseudoteredinibacter isoporae]|uniref:FAD-dependent oxidoreductase n=1 Tax=Pseudoteredinibacter isoporae TaxID=570281 RepID=UPI003102AF32